MKKFVYSFNEGSKDMRDLLGGKGANLAEMTKIGLPVPFGFTVTTEAQMISLHRFLKNSKSLRMLQERSSEALKIRCWYLFAQEQRFQCLA